MGRPPMRPIQYTELSETRAPTKPLSITSGSASCPPLAKQPAGKENDVPRSGEAEVVQRRPEDYDEVAVGQSKPATKSSTPSGGFGMDPMKSRRLCMSRTGYTMRDGEGSDPSASARCS